LKKVLYACDAGPLIYVFITGLHGLDHPGRGDGDTGAEPCQCHPGKYNPLCMLTNIRGERSQIYVLGLTSANIALQYTLFLLCR
jgi:hypothetical protein